MDILIVALIFIGSLIFCLIRGISLTWVLALTFVSLVCFGLHRKKTVKELWAMVRGELPGVLIVVRILCYVGLITGLWRSSGTIGIFIWYGMKLIPPRLFLLLAFLLSALLSYAIGTSFGVAVGERDAELSERRARTRTKEDQHLRWRHRIKLRQHERHGRKT